MASNKRVVLVTGGSSGIGEAAALEFARLGYQVAITGRNGERLKQVSERLLKVAKEAGHSGNPGDFLSLQADFEKPAEVEPVVSRVVDKFGGLDVLVNNAGFVGQRKTLFDANFYQDFQSVLQVNLMAATRLTQLAAPHLIERRGVVINVSSVADRLAIPTVSYSVSKAAFSMLTKTLANAFDGKQVRAVGIAPGPIATNFAPNMESSAPTTALGRVGRADEVAALIAFAASDKAGFIHGSTLDIDGGFLAKFGGLFSAMKAADK